MPLVTDPDTEFCLERSRSPITVDGFAQGEYKWLICPECGERVLLTSDPSAGIDDFPHRPDCRQRHVHWEWFFETIRAEIVGVRSDFDE